MELFGKANWWLPGWLDRILPRLRLEEPSPAMA
jgi:RND superfamily putative drug exporter